MSFRFTIVHVLSIVCLTVPAWADYQAGMDANNRGDYATAWFRLSGVGVAHIMAGCAAAKRDGLSIPGLAVQVIQIESSETRADPSRNEMGPYTCPLLLSVAE
jgi:hypothetical protein